MKASASSEGTARSVIAGSNGSRAAFSPGPVDEVVC